MKRKLTFVTMLSSAAILFSALFIAGCGSAQELTSSWPAQAIQIDGNSQDWQSGLQAFPKENYSVGLKNDGSYLYLCFITSDRSKIMSIMRSGMSIVLESPVNPAKNYTIRFPLVNPALLREAVGSLGPDALQKESVNFLFQELLDKQMQFNIIQGEILSTVNMKNKENIEVKMGSTNESVVLELKLPLATTESIFQVGAMPGDKLNVTFETDPAKVAFREGQSAGQSAPGGRSSGSGGRGGRGGNAGAQPAGGDQGAGGPVSITEKFSAGFAITLAKEVK
jgi:hypothetical protein